MIIAASAKNTPFVRAVAVNRRWSSRESQISHEENLVARRWVRRGVVRSVRLHDRSEVLTIAITITITITIAITITITITITISIT